MTKNFQYKTSFDRRLIKAEPARQKVNYAYSVMFMCLPPDLFLDYMRKIHKLHHTYAFQLLSNVAYHYQNQDREHTLDAIGDLQSQQIQNALFRDMYRYDRECDGGFYAKLFDELDRMKDVSKKEGAKHVLRQLIDTIEVCVVED